jgi:hypothetical protein
MYGILMAMPTSWWRCPLQRSLLELAPAGWCWERRAAPICQHAFAEECWTAGIGRTSMACTVSDILLTRCSERIYS